MRVLEKNYGSFLKKEKSKEDEEEGGGPLLDYLPFTDQIRWAAPFIPYKTLAFGFGGWISNFEIKGQDLLRF